MAAGTSDEKQRFMICYDYGMDGLWGILLARSEDEIHQTYPELAIVKEQPAWMDDADLARINAEEPEDIDEPPRTAGILRAVVADRSK